MKQKLTHVITFSLLTIMLIWGNLYAFSSMDAIKQIQDSASQERLFSETKRSISQEKDFPAISNLAQSLQALEEIARYNIRRDRPLAPTLSYILANREKITAISHQTLDDMIGAYTRDVYYRHVLIKNYEAWLREKKHTEALAQLPAGTVVPTPSVSDTYQSIMVDLSDQRMYVFEEGVLVASSSITSGKRWYSTVQWDFEVLKKQHGRQLVSPFKDPKQYYNLHVDYWIQFHKSGYGIHDACNSKNCWRKEFGGSDYVWRGSHGCVNTPYEFVKWLYDWVLPGTRVSVVS